MFSGHAYMRHTVRGDYFPSRVSFYSHFDISFPCRYYKVHVLYTQFLPTQWHSSTGVYFTVYHGRHSVLSQCSKTCILGGNSIHQTTVGRRLTFIDSISRSATSSTRGSSGDQATVSFHVTTKHNIATRRAALL